MRKKLYFVEGERYCCIFAATSPESARLQWRDEWGNSNLAKKVREATEKDIAHVAGFGGRVPRLAKK